MIPAFIDEFQQIKDTSIHEVPTVLIETKCDLAERKLRVTMIFISKNGKILFYLILFARATSYPWRRQKSRCTIRGPILFNIRANQNQHRRDRSWTHSHRAKKTRWKTWAEEEKKQVKESNSAKLDYDSVDTFHLGKMSFNNTRRIWFRITAKMLTFFHFWKRSIITKFVPCRSRIFKGISSTFRNIPTWLFSSVIEIFMFTVSIVQ